MSRKLDAEVAEKVMGWCEVGLRLHGRVGRKTEGLWGIPPTAPEQEMFVPFYSTDISSAWPVLDDMVWRVGTAVIRLDMEDYGRGAGTSFEGAERAVWVTIGEHTAFGPAPEAICKAALAAMEHLV